jgi:hypothetical protein
MDNPEQIVVQMYDEVKGEFTKEILNGNVFTTLHFAGGIAGDIAANIFVGKEIDKITKVFNAGKYSDDVLKGASNNINTSKILDSASAAKKGGETVAGHALQKHAGRNPDIWGKVSGNSVNINKTAMQHIEDIICGPGEFKTVQTNGISFLEKILPDGRGIRLNMDGTFKGFIDQIR